LDAESRSLPYGFLIWVSLAAIVLLSISWPLFKLRYMGNSERFSPRDGWYLILALFLMSTGAAMMLLNASYIRQARDAADQEMRDLARQIKENFTAEIKSAFTQLRELRNDGNFAGARLGRISVTRFGRTGHSSIPTFRLHFGRTATGTNFSNSMCAPRQFPRLTSPDLNSLKTEWRRS
jgi:hypothetical protein